MADALTPDDERLMNVLEGSASTRTVTGAGPHRRWPRMRRETTRQDDIEVAAAIATAASVAVAVPELPSSSTASTASALAIQTAVESVIEDMALVNRATHATLSSLGNNKFRDMAHRLNNPQQHRHRQALHHRRKRRKSKCRHVALHDAGKGGLAGLVQTERMQKGRKRRKSLLVASEKEEEEDEFAEVRDSEVQIIASEFSADSVEYQVLTLRGLASYLDNSAAKLRLAADDETGSCRWIHTSGVSSSALAMLQRRFKFDPQIVDAARLVGAKPSVTWYQPVAPEGVQHKDCKGRRGSTCLFDKASNAMVGAGALVIIAHELQISDDADADANDGADADSKVAEENLGGLDFEKEQVTFICLPEFNTLISVHCNTGRQDDSFESVRVLLSCGRGKLRKGSHWSQLLLVLLDSMVDVMYPLLDLYGDALEGLDLWMVQSPEPLTLHVQASHKLKRRVHTMRRYAWDCKSLMLELVQNQHNVFPFSSTAHAETTQHVRQLISSCSQNSTEMVAMCEAWVQRCDDIDAFYERHQDKRMNDTLFMLTLASVTTMPIFSMTGLYGMNFDPTSPFNLPELSLTYGYIWWWVVVGLSTLLVVFLLWWHGMLRSLHQKSLFEVIRGDVAMQEEMKREDEMRKRVRMAHHGSCDATARRASAAIIAGQDSVLEFM